MTKIKILGICPYRGLATLLKHCATQYPNIALTTVIGNMDEGLSLARQYHHEYDIIISRANTASMISKEVSIPVIDIGIHDYDVLRCLKMAEITRTKFAVLGFHSLTSIAKTLCDILQLPVDIFSVNTISEAKLLLNTMKAQEYKTVICDASAYDHAKSIGITPILLTTSIQSITTALEHAIDIWQKHRQLYDSLSIVKQILHTNTTKYIILDEKGNCVYSSLTNENLSPILQQIQDQSPKWKACKKNSFFIKNSRQVYSVRSEHTFCGKKHYHLFRLMPSPIPATRSRFHIQFLDRETCLERFQDSLYYHTAIGHELLESITAMSSSNAPLMILGENGTEKDRLAEFYYANRRHCKDSFYKIDCFHLPEKDWRFLTQHDNSPFTNTRNVIYFSHLEYLTDSRQKQLLCFISDTQLHVRNQLIFSCSHPWGSPLSPIIQEFINRLSCSPLSIRPLRHHPQLLEISANLYIGTISQSLDKHVVGLDSEATKIFLGYDFPGNCLQFKRILRDAVQQTENAYISKDTMAQLLHQETSYYPTIDAFPTHDEPHLNITSQHEGFSLNLNQSLDQMNRKIILHVLEDCHNNQTAAAKRLGISRTTLWRYIKQ